MAKMNTLKAPPTLPQIQIIIDDVPHHYNDCEDKYENNDNYVNSDYDTTTWDEANVDDTDYYSNNIDDDDDIDNINRFDFI